MTVVRLTSWEAGFVPNRLVALLRDAGLGLAQSHELATPWAEDHEVSVCFDDEARAADFSRRAGELGVKLVTNPGARAAS